MGVDGARVHVAQRPQLSRSPPFAHGLGPDALISLPCPDTSPHILVNSNSGNNAFVEHIALDLVRERTGHVLRC